VKRDPDKSATPGEDDAFLSRWSRRKEEARNAPPPAPAGKTKAPESPAPELPSLDKLSIDSDFRPFFHPKVDEDVRRAALKKLFGDPRFNVMDGLDVYIDDYSKTEPIPPEMMAGLRQAQNILQWAKEDTEERERKEREKERQASGEATRAIEPPASSAEVKVATPDGAPAIPADTSEAPKS
jgi:uncharacterized protein DUF3306